MPAIVFFLSYSTKDPDGGIARDFNNGLLQKGYETFMAEASLKLGDVWADVIERQINGFDYFLVFLSENSISSDMVIEEIRRAKKYYDSRPAGKKPGIFIIRIKLPLDRGINYDIDGYLSKFQQRVWEHDGDTRKYLEEIYEIVSSAGTNALFAPVSDANLITYDLSIPSPVAPLTMPGGAVRPDSPYYIQRVREKGFIEMVETENALLRITSPRQYGKTSLLNKVVQHAKATGHATASVSLQLMDSDKLTSLSDIFRFICKAICKQNNISDQDTVQALGNIFTEEKQYPIDEFIECMTNILKRINAPLFLAIDESDMLFRLPNIAKAFFAVFRALNDHSNGDIPIYQIYKKFKVGFTYAADVVYAIPDINQSPFNIGEEFRLLEFTPIEVRELSIRHGLQLSGVELSKLYELVGGHPFLVRKALYYLAKQAYRFDELVDSAHSDGGPFDDTLRKLFWTIRRKPGYAGCLLKILSNSELDDYDIADRLKASGIIDGPFPYMRIKNKLFKDFLIGKLNKSMDQR